MDSQLIKAAFGESQTRMEFKTRGVVLTSADLTWTDWPVRVKQAGLTTIALHPTPRELIPFAQSTAGHRFLEHCRSLRLQIEFELHAMSDLLPRSLFEANRSFFRMNEKGERSPDSNLCVHSPIAMDLAAEKAASIARILRPSTNRYFYWGDDGAPWCRCEKCRDLTDSDQALILENHILNALRQVDRKAKQAHLAYANTLRPPTLIKPEPGIFLEFAPIERRYDRPLSDPTAAENVKHIEALSANLKWFGSKDAQALEYWLDVSRFSRWKKPAIKLPWNPDVVAADLDTYARLGIRHATTFAVYIDKEYVDRFGEPPLNEYGRLLTSTPR